MNAVIYYSNTNESKAVARYLAEKTGYCLLDIFEVKEYCFENLVLVFPVHCQNIPETVKAFLSRLDVKNLAVIATYGRMSYGNVLYELQRAYSHTVVAGAYVPTKHAYLRELGFSDFEKLDVIAEKMKAPTEVKIPKSFKNPLADIFPAFRSRLGVKMTKNARCTNCGVCEKICPNGAIANGKPNRACIRCLKCAVNCPQQAIMFHNRLPMALYLKKKKRYETVIYV